MCMTLSFLTFASESEVIGDQLLFKRFYETFKDVKMTVLKARDLGTIETRVNLVRIGDTFISWIKRRHESSNSLKEALIASLMMTID